MRRTTFPIAVFLTVGTLSLAQEKTADPSQCRSLADAGNFVGPDEVLVNGMVCKVLKTTPSRAPVKDEKAPPSAEKRQGEVFVGISAGQSLEFTEIAHGTIGSDDDAQIDWEGRRLYLSGYSGYRNLGLLGSLFQNAQLRAVDLKSGVEGKKQVFKDLRKNCKENDRFTNITFVGPDEFIAEYCGALYVLDAETLAVKKQFSLLGGLQIAHGGLALRWAEATKTLVAYWNDTVTVFEGNRWERVAAWAVPEISEMVISRDGTLVALQPKENRCKFSVKRLPYGESLTEFSVDNCHLPVQLLSGGKGTTAASIQQTLGAVVLTLWDLATGKKENEIVLEDSANIDISSEELVGFQDLHRSVLASPDWKWIVGNQRGNPHTLLVWDPNTGKVAYRSPQQELPRVRGRIGPGPPVPTQPTTGLSLSGDGQSVFVESYWFQIGSFYSVWRAHI